MKNLRTLAVIALALFATASAHGQSVGVPNWASPANVYVSTTGSDTNNNCQSSAAACATIQHAILKATAGLNSLGLSSAGGNSVVVNLAAGSYAQSVYVSGPLPGSYNTTPNPNGTRQPGQILIKGAGSTTTTISGDAGLCGGITASWGAIIGLADVKVTGNANSCMSSVFAQIGGIINIYDDVDFGAATVEQIHIEDSGSQVQAWCPYKISGGAERHIVVANGNYKYNAFCSVGSDANQTLTSTTHSNTTVDGISSTSGLSVGAAVTGSGIPIGTTIASIVNGTSITLSQAATATATVSLTYTKAITLTGTPVFSDTFVLADYGGSAQFNGNAAFYGAATGQRYRAQNNATIVTQSSTSASFFPGDSAGQEYYGGRWVQNNDINIAVGYANSNIRTATTGTGEITFTNAGGTAGLYPGGYWSAPQLALSGLTFAYFGDDGTNAYLNFDSGDFVKYVRSTNQYEFNVGSVVVGRISSSGFNAADIGAGTLPSGRISGSYTGLTGTGTLAAGATGAGFTIDFGASTQSGVVDSAHGGAGSVSGILKGNGSGGVSAAVSSTDYAPPTSGSALQKGNGSGGFSAYAGTSCTAQFPRSLSSAGAATCASVDLTADVTGTLPTGNGGYPQAAWTSFTPTLSCGSGTLTSASATGAYQQIGKSVKYRTTITITTNGTCAGQVRATLPVNAADTQAGAGSNGNNQKALNVQIGGGANSNPSYVTYYDGTYPGADGVTLYVNGEYEAF